MTTISLTVTATNDGYGIPGGGSSFNTSNWVCGRVTAGRAFSINNAVFRFTGVTIPVGATIAACTVSYTLANGSGTPDLRVYFEAADNPTMPTTGSDIAGRPVTANYLTINAAYPGTGRYTTADMSAACQEVVNRGGWASGNAMSVHWRDNNTTYPRYYEGRQADYNSGSDAATLDITYTAPASGTGNNLLLLGVG